MAQQSIGVGTSANDGTGDALRDAFIKINDNFTEVYTELGGTSLSNISFTGNTIISDDTNGNINITPNGTGGVVITNTLSAGATDVTTLTASGAISSTVATTAASGSLNLTSTQSSLRMNKTGGTVDLRTMELVTFNGSLAMRNINDAQTVFTDLFKFHNAGDFDVLVGNTTLAGTLSAGATDVTTLTASGKGLFGGATGVLGGNLEVITGATGVMATFEGATGDDLYLINHAAGVVGLQVNSADTLRLKSNTVSFHDQAGTSILNATTSTADFNAANLTTTGTLSAGNTTVQGSAPILKLYEDDVTADNGKWRMAAAAEQFTLQTLNDAESVASTFMLVNRTGTTVDNVTFHTGAGNTNLTLAGGATPTATFAGTLSATTATFSNTIYVNRIGDAADVNLYLQADPTKAGQILFNDGVANSGIIKYNHATDVMTINSGNALTLTLDSSQNATFAGTLDVQGGQIKFPATQNASADANTLDDYEEGTWTPVFRGGTGNPTVGYATQEGTYTKIGRKVYVRGRITLSSASGGSGTLRIGGLPFTSAAVFSPMNVGFKNNFATTGPDSGYINTGSDYIDLWADNNTSITALTPANLSATTDIIFEATYHV